MEFISWESPFAYFVFYWWTFFMFHLVMHYVLLVWFAPQWIRWWGGAWDDRQH